MSVNQMIIKRDDEPMDAIIPIFEDSIFDTAIVDVGIELTELGIDSLIDNPFVESIPIAKTLLGVTKTAQNFNNRNLLMQTFAFCTGFNSGAVDEEKVKKYRRKISENPKFAESELGRILIILNKTVEKGKSVILGNLFRAYIMEDITWRDFCELSDAVEGLFISDIPILKEFLNEKIDNPDADVAYRCSRLNALGLVIIKTADAKNTVGTIHIGSYVTISEFGKEFIKYGLTETE